VVRILESLPTALGGRYVLERELGRGRMVTVHLIAGSFTQHRFDLWTI
jgi:hypothetical protein